MIGVEQWSSSKVRKQQKSSEIVIMAYLAMLTFFG